MATQYIRIPKTPELEIVLNTLKKYYIGMSEAEIFKKNTIDDYRKKIPFESFPSENLSPDLEKQLLQISLDIQNGEYEGPFNSAEDFILSLKK